MKTLPALALCTITLLTAVTPPVLAEPPFEYKGDRPGTTTLAEFRRTHGKIYDAKHNMAEHVFAITTEAAVAYDDIACDHPMKNNAYITDLTYCDTAKESSAGVTVHWEFVGGTLSFIRVYFPPADYDAMLTLLENKYGQPVKTRSDVARTEAGAAIPYTTKLWKSMPVVVGLRTVSYSNVNRASLELSDMPLSDRYDKLSSNASI